MEGGIPKVSLDDFTWIGDELLMEIRGREQFSNEHVFESVIRVGQEDSEMDDLQDMSVISMAVLP